jgi:hypothetical protein
MPWKGMVYSTQSCQLGDQVIMESWTLVRMDDFGCTESTNVIQDGGRSLCCSRRLGREQLYPSRKSIDDNKYVLVAMCVLRQRSNVIQVKHFEWIIRSTGESMSLDLYFQTIHHLACRALTNEF